MTNIFRVKDNLWNEFITEILKLGYGLRNMEWDNEREIKIVGKNSSYGKWYEGDYCIDIFIISKEIRFICSGYEPYLSEDFLIDFFNLSKYFELIESK